MRLPLNVYVIEHENGLVLFDTRQNRAVVTDPDYYPDRITALFMRNIFRWHIGPDDTLTVQLERAGYSVEDVKKAVISHLHSDHVSCIDEIPQAWQASGLLAPMLPRLALKRYPAMALAGSVAVETATGDLTHKRYAAKVRLFWR